MVVRAVVTNPVISTAAEVAAVTQGGLSDIAAAKARVGRGQMEAIKI